MSDPKIHPLDNIQFNSVISALALLGETTVYLAQAKPHAEPGSAFIANLHAQFDLIEDHLHDLVKETLCTDRNTDRFRRKIMETGSSGLVGLIPDDDTGSVRMKREILEYIAITHPVDFFRKLISKGLYGGDLIRPLLTVAETRRDLHSFLMDELAMTYLARTSGGHAEWSSITSFLIKGPSCVPELIRRQHAAFPSEMRAAAVGSWQQGHALNTSLHVLLGAPAEIFVEPRVNVEVLTALAESFASGHGKLRLIRHFGDLHENHAYLEDLHNAWMSTLDVAPPKEWRRQHAY
jgi:hypothetical protein